LVSIFRYSEIFEAHQRILNPLSEGKLDEAHLYAPFVAATRDRASELGVDGSVSSSKPTPPISANVGVGFGVVSRMAPI
jgi:hypothetical protein